MPLPYIHFQGRCAEALAFYAEVFGGSGLELTRYDDSPEAHEAWKGSGRVMHGQITLPDGLMMGSDFPPGTEGDPQKAVSAMQSMPDTASARSAFDRLLEGGDVILPFGPNFFSPGFGMVRDRFGTHWMIWTAPAPGGTEAPA